MPTPEAAKTTETAPFMFTAADFDPLLTALNATGLSKEQYENLVLVWIEIRRFFLLLGRYNPEELDVGLEKRNRWLQELESSGPEHDVSGKKDSLGIPRSRWDHIQTEVKTLQGQKKQYTKGEVGLWVRWSTAASNIYHSRLWEIEFYGLRHSVPLRMVHKYYMLQFEVSDEDPFIVVGNKSEKFRAKKGPLYSQEAFQLHGPSRQDETFTFAIQKAIKRFPEDLTPSMFWGMLQIFWYRNLQSLERCHPKLSASNRITISSLKDRIKFYFDEYCKASRFDKAGESYMDFTPKKRNLGPSLGDNFADRQRNLGSNDKFQWWKQYLYELEDVDLPDFDYTFTQFLCTEYTSALQDELYALTVHSRAAYLTRIWDHEAHDEQLSKAIVTISEKVFHGKRFQILLRREPYASERFPEIYGLIHLYYKQESEFKSILNGMSQQFAFARSYNPQSRIQLSEEQIEALEDQIPRTFYILALMFGIIDKMRDTVARFIDVCEDDEKSVSSQLETLSKKGTSRWSPMRVRMRAKAKLWLDCAAQYGFVSCSEFGEGEEDRWSSADRRTLFPITVKAKEVSITNKRKREEREALHLPQRARRHTKEMVEKGKIQYDKSVLDYAHPYDEYLYHWRSSEGALEHKERNRRLKG